MLHYVTINIDGADIKAPKGTSVLDTAIEYGICIPHLCHVPGLSDMRINGQAKLLESLQGLVMILAQRLGDPARGVCKE